ncbi:hypothetical protein [Photobacterium leiognathi]|nr:hypothetical protein [Photobacterium leiognathi]
MYIAYGERRGSLVQEQTPLQKLTNDLIEEYKNNHHDIEEQMSGKAAILWMKFFYLRDNFKSIKMDDYKDFVELASPLDWMGKDELTETD